MTSSTIRQLAVIFGLAGIGGGILVWLDSDDWAYYDAQYHVRKDGQRPTLELPRLRQFESLEQCKSGSYYQPHPITRWFGVWWIYDGRDDVPLRTIYGREMEEIADRKFPSGETTLGDLLSEAGYCNGI